MDWIKEHLLEIAGGAAALLVLSWLYRHAGRVFARDARGKYYCRHCNWEGIPPRSEHRCRRCGSKDLAPLTH